MNETTGSDPGRRRGSRWPTGILATAASMVLLAVLMTACGASPSSTSSSGSAGAGSTQSQELAFARCARSHGVPNFPDPSASGGFSGVTLQQLGISSSRLQALQRACQHLLPNGPGNRSKNISQALRVAQCMRSHGVPNYPDPNPNATTSLSTQLAQLGIDPDSAQFRAASQTCGRLYPRPSPSAHQGG